MNYEFKIEINFRNETTKVYENVNGYFTESGIFGVVDGNKKHIYPIDLILNIHVTDNTVYPAKGVQ
jgi:hypothetical protein